MTIIELFQKLLRFKSITPDDDGAFDFIEEYLGDTWSCIKVDMEGVKNRFYYKKFNDNPQHLCFAGHIDVVPVGSGWEVDPFAADIIDGVITARGTQDMKSGDAAFLYACKHAKDFDGTLSILMTSDEEGEGTYGTIKMLEHLKEIDFIYNNNEHPILKHYEKKFNLKSKYFTRKESIDAKNETEVKIVNGLEADDIIADTVIDSGTFASTNASLVLSTAAQFISTIS